MTITLKEISQLSGYGYGTVARALSSHPYSIKKETLERIQKIAKQYGYKKNLAAQALVSGQTNDIGLVIPAMFASPYYRDFYMKVISGIMDVLEDVDSSLRIVFLKHQSSSEKIIEEIIGLRLQGVILSPYCRDFILTEEEIKKMDMPVVVLGKAISGNKITSIILDDFQGGYDGTKYLIDLGHRDIAIIRGFRDDIEKRYDGYLSAMSANGFTVPERFIMQGDAMSESAYKLVMELLHRPEDRPTAIFALDDEMAYGALKAAKDSGVSVPGELSILGFDGIEVGEFVIPPISTMKRPVIEMAKTAVKRIQCYSEMLREEKRNKGKNMIEENPEKYGRLKDSTIVVKAAIVERESCVRI